MEIAERGGVVDREDGASGRAGFRNPFGEVDLVCGTRLPAELPPFPAGVDVERTGIGEEDVPDFLRRGPPDQQANRRFVVQPDVIGDFPRVNPVEEDQIDPENPQPQKEIEIEFSVDAPDHQIADAVEHQPHDRPILLGAGGGGFERGDHVAPGGFAAEGVEKTPGKGVVQRHEHPHGLKRSGGGGKGGVDDAADLGFARDDVTFFEPGECTADGDAARLKALHRLLLGQKALPGLEFTGQNRLKQRLINLFRELHIILSCCDYATVSSASRRAMMSFWMAGERSRKFTNVP